jgi:hypothetical protein
MGGLLIAYALLVYPTIGHWLGRGYPYSPAFGVAPCPMAIFTFGLLLWADGKIPAPLMIIPYFWVLVGTSAALFLGVREDLGLLAAGLLTGACFLGRHPAARKAVRTAHTRYAQRRA